MSTENVVISSRYRLYEKLGTGGMGAVYRAVDRLNGAVIALKQVTGNVSSLNFGSKSSNSNLQLALANEFQALASLRHPNIIPVLDYGFHDNLPYFTMQYVPDARSITDFAQQKPESIRLNLLAQMLRALAYLHRRSIVHRDLKPENALVDPEGHLYLLDFGLAEENPHASGEGLIIGTLAYLAPEVLQGADPTPSADLYALGTIAYELFAGQHPFNLRNAATLITDIIKVDPDLSRLETSDEIKEIIEKLLAKTPSERYRSAEEVLKALQQIATVPALVENPETRNSYLQAARFVGRDGELKQLTDALDNALAGTGSAWLVGGESGVGKSRLIEEVRVRALIRGALALRGQAVTGGGLLYQIWQEPLRRLLLHAPISDLDAGILKELVQDIEQLLERDIEPAPIVDPDAHRKRLSAAILALFRHVQQPMVLLLEDLQWAADDLDLLKNLMAIAEELPLLILANYRSDETPDLPQKLDGIHKIQLERLHSTEIARLSQSMLGETGRDRQVLDLLEKETEGNIFFIVETVRALAEEAGSLHNVGRMTLPQSVFAGGVKRVIERRLERIPDAYRPLLHAAAVAGRRIDLAVMRHYAPEVDSEEWTTACVNAAVLSIQDGIVQFSHDKLREGLLKTLDTETIRNLHNGIARAIEAAYPADESRAVILAHHWKHARDAEKEATYSYLAGKQQRHVHPAEARQYLMRALDLLAVEDTRIAQIQYLLGEVSSGMSENSIAEQAYRAALQHTISSGDLVLRARCLEGLGIIALRSGQHELSRNYHRDALNYARQTGTHDLIAQSLCSLGGIELEESAYESAIQYFNEALQEAEAHNHKVSIGRIFNSLGVIAYRRGDHQQATSYFEKTLHLRRELGMRHGIAAGLNNLGVMAETIGNYQQAIQYHQESLGIKRDIGDRFGMATSLHNLGICAMHLRKFEDALIYLRDAITIARAIHSVQGEADTLNIIGLVMRRSGSNLQEAQSHFERALTLSREVNDRLGVALILGNIADILLEQGQVNAALPILREALQESEAIQAMQPMLRALMWFGKLAAMRGDLAAAIRIWSFVNLHEGCDGETRSDSELLLATIVDQFSVEQFVKEVEASKQLTLDSLVAEFLKSS